MSDYTPTQNVGLVLPVKSAIDAVKNRFMGVDGNYTGANKVALGVTNRNVNAGAEVGLNVNGRIIIEAGDTITVADEPVPIMSNAEGQAIPVTNLRNQRVNGYAIESGEAGEMITIIRGI